MPGSGFPHGEGRRDVMKCRKDWRLSFVIMLLAMGCAYGRLHMGGEEFKQKHLPFLETGKTTKEDVLLRFGAPSA